MFFNKTRHILIKFTDTNIIKRFPLKAYKSDAGFDVFCTKDQLIEPGVNRINLGYHLYIPKHTFVQYYSRSSLLLKGIVVPPNVVDAGFTGEQSLIIYSNIKSYFSTGDRIAQLIIHPHHDETIFEEVDKLPSTDRGNNRFGSSGI